MHLVDRILVVYTPTVLTIAALATLGWLTLPWPLGSEPDLQRAVFIVIPTLAPSAKPTRGFIGSHLLGLPFGLSSCPACTPMLFPVVAATAATASPLMGAVLMATFGLARSVPIMVAATVAGSTAHLKHTRAFWAERVSAALVFAAALYFFYQAALYAGWLRP